MSVCLRLAPAEAPSTELGGGECALCSPPRCAGVPLCTTAAINRLQSSLALSACKSGAVVVVGVSLGSGAGATTFPSSPGSGSGLISCEFVTRSIQLHHCEVFAIW